MTAPGSANPGSGGTPSRSSADRPRAGDLPTRGAGEPDWSVWKPNVRATLLFIRDGGRLLLMRKKRGIGAGKINAPGGKIDPGESPLECALRETGEELGVTARDPVEMGELSFEFTDGLRMHVTVFLAHAHEGEPVETDEAIPRWTPVDAIPYAEMWEDDPFWLPRMLEGRRFRGFFVFHGERMLRHRVDFPT